MKTVSMTGVMLLAFSFGGIGTVSAQEDDGDGSERRENVIYYTLSMVDFKPGMNDEAWEIIYDHFVPVDMAIGRKVIPFDIQSGGWDHAVFFPMGGNTDELEWSRSPQDVAWWNALVAQEGGEEAAEALMARFNGLVARSERHLVHRHTDIGEGSE